MLTKKRIIAIVCFLVIFAVACFVVVSNKGTKDKDSGKKETTADDYTTKLSDDEINGNHIKLNLNKNVAVDADITPLSEYRDGVDIYYTKRMGSDKLDYKKFKKTPVIFDITVKDLLKVIEKNSKGKFAVNKMVTKNEYNDYYSCDVNYLGKDKKKGLFSCFVEVDDNKTIFSERSYFDAHTAENMATSDSLSKISIGGELLRLKSGLDEPELSFGSKSEIGDKMVGLIKDITKSDNYGSYKCVVLNDKTFSSVFENSNLYKDIEIKPIDSECYVYFLPYVIDGFEWKTSEGMQPFGDLRETEGLKFADDIAYSDSELYPLNAGEQEIAFNEDGILEMNLYQSLKLDGVYKEKQKVLPVNDVVNILQEYFNGKAPFETSVYNIKICYTGMFSDASDGKLRNIAKPYWCVEYTEKRNNMKQYGTLFVDVTTGDVY